MSDLLYNIALLLHGVIPVIAMMGGSLFQRFARDTPLAGQVARIGIALLLFGMILPYLFLLFIEFDAYLFSSSSSYKLLPWINELPIHVDGFGMIARLIASLVVFLLLWDLHRGGQSRWNREPVPVGIGAFGMLFGFFLISGTDNLLILWGGVEIMLFAAQIMVGRTVRPLGGKSVGGFYAGLALLGMVLFYGMFGTMALSGIYSSLSTPNVEIVQLNPLLLGTLLLLAGLIARVGSGVAGLFRKDVGMVLRKNGLLSLFLLWGGAMIAVRLFSEMFPSYLFGLDLTNILLIMGTIVGVVCGLLAIGTDDRVKMLCYGMGGHIGIALLGFVFGAAGGVFGSRTWLAMNMLLSLGLLFQITRLDVGLNNSWVGKKKTVLAIGLAHFKKFGTGFLFLALAGLPFTGGFIARVVIIGSTIPSPLAAYSSFYADVPRRFFLYDPERPVDLFGPIFPFIAVGLVLSVLLLYAYGRLFKRLYLAVPDEGSGNNLG